MKSTFTIIFILITATGFCANPQIDSLKNVLNSGISDDEKIAVYNKIGVDYSVVNGDSSLHYINTAMTLARELNDEEGVANSLHNFGEYYLYRSLYDSAEFFLERALKIRQRLGLKKEEALTLSIIGETHRSRGNYETAVEYFTKALKRAEKESNEAASAKTNLGLVFMRQERYEDAENLFMEAIDIFTKEGSYQLVANCYINLAAIEYYQDDNDAAINRLKKALDIYIENNNTNGQANCLNNIGAALNETGNYKEAEKYFEMSMEKFLELKNHSMVNTITINLGKLNVSAGNYERAKEYLNKGLQQAKAENNRENIKYVYSYFSYLYNAAGNYKKANEYLHMYIEIKDSLLNEKNSAAIINLEKQFKKEQREKEIAQLKLQQRDKELEIIKNKNQRNVVAGVSFLALFLFFFSIFYYKKRQENSVKTMALQKEKINALLKTNEISYANAMIEGQEAERKRVAQDLHDRVGSMLATAKLHFSTGTEKDIERSHVLIDEAIEEVRRISHNLSSSALMRYGLVSALQGLADAIDSNELKVEFYSHGIDERLSSKIEVSLYRCVQELVSNIIKHADADKLTIQLHNNDDGLNLIVEDNGIGFDTSREFKGIGLKNVKARINALEGEIEFDSRKGRGTSVIINIPHRS